MYPARDLNRGWIHVEHSTLPRADQYATEQALEFSGGFVEVRQYRWDRPLENLWTTDKRCYLVNMALGADSPATGRNLNMRGARDPAPMGRMFLVPPGQTMQCSSPRGKSRSIRCALDAALIETHLGARSTCDWDDARVQESLHLRSGEIEWLVRRMYRELREPDFGTVHVVEALAQQLAVEIVRKFRLRESGDGHRAGGLAPWRMRLIRERLQSPQPPPDLAELAALCDMTVRHLGRAFRAETGQTIGQHIEGVMIARATAMLAAGDPVQEVATTLGYAKSGSFAAAFRRATGLLPSEVRRGN